jgi:predicted short-subunit dehydrogenase-like oxidoreductase (DUF2520 family)
VIHAVVGWGRLAQALVPALQGLGHEVRIGRRAGPLTPAQAAQQADWVWLTVPDDALAATAAALPWRAGQLALHCSGATPLSALAAAPEAAGFHPLRLFAGGPASLAGTAVGIEAGPAHQAALHDLACALGLTPLALPTPMDGAARAAYHAAAHLAANGLLAVLAESTALWQQAGLPAGEALAALLPLSRGALQAAAERGLAGAVSGPVARGDVGVVARHLAVLAPPDLYRALSLRQLALAEQAGRLDAAQAAALRQLLGS